MLASDIDGVKERSKGDRTDWRAYTDRANATVGKERTKAKRLQNRLEEAE